MKYPFLIPKQLCKTPITITIHDEGLSEDGGPIVAFEGELFCNYQDSAKSVLTGDKKLVQLTGKALLPGDICPHIPNLSGGTALINGVKRTIYSGTKARNPDGTVNYTELRLM